MKTPDHIQKAREAHHAALERLTGKPGLATWRKLRRLEAKASAITTELCNGTLDQERCDAALDDIRAKVEAVIGRPFYLNREQMRNEFKPQWAVCRTYMPCGESELRFVRASTEREALAVFGLEGTEEELNAKGIAYCARRVQP